MNWGPNFVVLQTLFQPILRRDGIIERDLDMEARGSCLPGLDFNDGYIMRDEFEGRGLAFKVHDSQVIVHRSWFIVHCGCVEGRMW
jgi:hypothetical protein